MRMPVASNTALASAGAIPGVPAVDDMGLDAWRFVHPDGLIVMEVALHDGTVLDGNLTIQCGGEAVDDT